MRHFQHPGFEFRQIDPARGRARRYHMSECASLFDEPAILITWGRIGSTPRVRLEMFTTESARRRRWNELLERRAAHGYEPLSASTARGGVAYMAGCAWRTSRQPTANSLTR